MRQQVPAIPAANYIVEPSGRGTAPCIGLAALYLRRADPEGVMCVLTADHYIKNVERFRQVLRAAARVAEDGYLVTLGITPSFPSTGFGYIRRSAPLGTVDGFEVWTQPRPSGSVRAGYTRGTAGCLSGGCLSS